MTHSYFHSIIYVDENAPALFKEFTTTSVVEATPDFLEIPHAGSASVLNHKESGEEHAKGKIINKFLVELYPLQLKTFILTLS